MEELYILKLRLSKIGINIEYAGNFPWVYIYSVNGKKVTEKYRAEHGFTIAFQSIKKDEKIKFTELNEIFKLIRKYIN